MSRIRAKLKNREKIAPRARSLRHELREAADAILTEAGHERLTERFFISKPGKPSGEEILIRRFRNQRVARYRKKTAGSLRERAERREKIAVGLELYRRAESKLIKKEQT